MTFTEMPLPGEEVFERGLAQLQRWQRALARYYERREAMPEAEAYARYLKEIGDADDD